MARAGKTYSKEDVIKILEDSEGRASPVNGQPGHCLAMHVTIADHHLTDRLVGKLPETPDPSRPLITDSQGRIMDKATHREIWKEINPGLTSNPANQDYRRIVENWKTKAGAFLNLEQAGLVGAAILNSTEGQSALATLDGGGDKDNATITMPTGGSVAWKMRFAEHGNDLPHEVAFTQAFIYVQTLPSDRFHIQTMFPIK